LQGSAAPGQTTAILDPTGAFYTVNGGKTFISGGMKADLFTTAVRCAALRPRLTACTEGGGVSRVWHHDC
jgi:alkylation response protein AidB-like acyl-CoA dehydrogenase